MRFGRSLMLFTSFWALGLLSTVPGAHSQDTCKALHDLEELISDWEGQEVVHPSKLEALKRIADELKACVQALPEETDNAEETGKAEEPQETQEPKEPGEAQEAAGFTGRWDTDSGMMDLKQTDNRVEGTYEQNHGKIEGTVTEDMLEGKWSEAPSYEEPDDKGDVVFVLSPDGKSFTGKWRNGSEGPWHDGWNGLRR